MKAIRVHKFGGIDKLKFEDDVIIPTCDNDKVLVRVIAAGVNPVDTYIRQGAYTYLPTLPFVPGAEGAGVIEEVGDSISEFKVGDRVYFARPHEGSYAQFCTVSQKNCWRLPDHLTFEQGAGIVIPYFTAFRALFQKARAREGETVLIHGASGGVGLAACQLARAAGLTVFGTAGTDKGLDAVKMCGATLVFNHRERGYIERIREATKDGRGIDIIIEMLANVNLAHDLDLLAQNGSVVIVGSRGSINIDPRAIMTNELKVFGVALFRSTPEEWREIGSRVLTELANKKLNPVVYKAFPLHEAGLAQKEIIESGGAAGKMVLSIDS